MYQSSAYHLCHLYCVRTDFPAKDKSWDKIQHKAKKCTLDRRS